MAKDQDQKHQEDQGGRREEHRNGERNNQHRQNKQNKAWDALLDEDRSNKNEIRNLHVQIQQLQAKLGPYLEREDVERLMDNVDLLQSKQQSEFA